ncbi:MAG: MATE family efflux transporter [Bacteroidota bacterium]
MPFPSNLRTQFKQHLVLALPIMISQLSHMSVAVADNVMVGRLGAFPLAACALANSALWPFFGLGMGISYALTPLVAAADASKHYKKATNVLKHSLVINLVFAAFFSTALMLATPVLHCISQTPTVSTLAAPYLRLLALSLIPFMLFQTFREYTEALSFTREAMYIDIGCSLVNVLLNYVLIYGKLGFPAMGLLGAGWATLVSRILMALVMVSYVLGAPKLRKRIVGLNCKGFLGPYFAKIIRIGLPTGLEFALDGIAYTATMVMVGWIGVTAQAAHTVAANLTTISMVAIWGIALATTIRVGNQWGLRNFVALRTAGFVGFALGGILALVAAGIFLGGRHVLPGLYTAESEVLSIASVLLIVVGIQQLSDSADGIGVCALRGIEDTTMPFIITVLSRWLLGVPLAYILCFSLAWGVKGLWWGLFVGKLISALAMLWRFDRKSRRLLGKLKT